MKNYIKKVEGGNYIATANAPTFGSTSTTGDYYINGIWYNSSGVAYTTAQSYLPLTVEVDTQGNVLDYDKFDVPTLVEEYIVADKVKAEFSGKNACTAWVNFDGTQTPVEIRDSYNVSAIVRTATGVFDIYFEEPMDNSDYTLSGESYDNGTIHRGNTDVTKLTILTRNIQSSGGTFNPSEVSVQIFGGKN